MGNIVQQQGFNDTPKPSLEMIYKFLTGLLISILLLLMSSDTSPANVIASGGNALVVAFINFNCANNSCTGGTGSSKRLSGFGSIDNQASASIGGNQGSANASLSVSSSGNAIIFNEKVSGSTIYCGSACPPTFMAVGSASGNGSFVMDIPGPARITIEIEANILLEPGNLITDVSVLTLDASGRFINLLSYTPPFECTFIPLCTQTATKKRDLDVVPGQKIIASAGVSGSALFTSEFSGDVRYTVRIIEGEKILSKVSGDSPVQEGPINSTLSKPFIVKVTDSSGNPVSGEQVNWTITGPAGATGQNVSPTTGTQVAVKLGDKPGPYTITATCPNCTSGSPVTFTATAKGCQGLNIKPFSEVLPSNSGIEGDTSTTIEASVSSPALSGGCEVSFSAPEPVAFSGGHNHDDSTRPHGTLDKTSCTIQEGTTLCTAKYTASEVSGEEKIKGKLTSTGEEAEGKVTVKVSGLKPLEAKPNLLSRGETDKHTLGNNNYGTEYTRNAVYYAVSEYATEYGLDPYIFLAVIDMSLPWGGLFDINGNWKPPHDWHRKGTSVDFSKFYRDASNNNIEVIISDEDGNVIETTGIIDDKELDRRFSNKDCTRKEKKIGKIHYECPK